MNSATMKGGLWAKGVIIVAFLAFFSLLSVWMFLDKQQLVDLGLMEKIKDYTEKIQRVEEQLKLSVESIQLLEKQLSLDVASIAQQTPTLTEPKGLEFRGLTKAAAASPNFNETDPTVCVVVRTLKAHRNCLPALVSSLASNNYPNLHIFLVDTMGDWIDMPSFESMFNTLYGKDFVHISENMTKQAARKRFPLFVQNDYGYLQTDLALFDLIAPDNRYKCDYVMFTNGDNLYSKALLTATILHLRDSIDLLATEFISHYCMTDTASFRSKLGCYTQYYTEFVLDRIDLGAAMIRTKKLAETKIDFLAHHLANNPAGHNLGSKIFGADGFFFQNLVRVGVSKIVVTGAYFVHQ